MSEITQPREKVEDFEVRRAGISDLDSIVSLALKFEQELRQERQEAAVDAGSESANLRDIYSARLSGGEDKGLKQFIFIAEDSSKNKPIGFIVGHVPYPKPEGDFYALWRGVYVLPEYRGGGVSGRLIEKFSDVVKEYGVHHIEFEVQEGGKGHNYLAKHATFLKFIPEANGLRRLRYSEKSNS